MRKKKTKEITIKSDETKITIGLLVAIVGIAVLLSPFLEAAVFDSILEKVGKASIIFGLAILYFAMRFLTNKSEFKSWKFTFGLIIIGLIAVTFLTFIIPQEILISKASFKDAGGELGLSIHTYLYTNFGQLLEFIILLFVFIVGITLTTGITLSQLRDFIEKILSTFGFVVKKSSEIVKIQGTEKTEDFVMHKNNNDTTQTEPEYKDYKTSLFGQSKDGKDEVTKSENKEKEKSKEEIRQEPVYIDNSQSNTATTNPTGSTTTTESTDGNIFEEPQYPNWQLPPISLLKDPTFKPQNPEIHKKNAALIEKTLASFGIQTKVVSIATGPTVVQYALSITVGTKVAKVINLANDLALALATASNAVRIEAPIPGTSLIGIEIPNPTPNFVFEKELMQQLSKTKEKYELPLIFGKSVTGQNIIKDLTDQPHLLVAGATGTGKSVGINSMLVSLLMSKSPDELRVILVDPKMVEMAPYNGIPHLLTPVITDMELVVNALQWAIEEMMRRYRILKQVGVRKIKEYNAKMGYNAMPYIVIVIDEMADLMLTTGVDVESKIVRLTQMSRAVGIHLILATQRPSVDVITGLIKANVPGRVSFSVSTSIDSRVVIDQTGAETLIGKGDMLFKSPEYQRPIRVQGAWTDTKDIENVIGFIKQQATEVHYYDEITQPKPEEGKGGDKEGDDFSQDQLFEDALNIVINAQKASASLLQRKLRIGYNRAARLVDELQEAGAIGPQEGSNPRKVLVASASQILGGKDEKDEIEELIGEPSEPENIF